MLNTKTIPERCVITIRRSLAMSAEMLSLQGDDMRPACLSVITLPRYRIEAPHSVHPRGHGGDDGGRHLFISEAALVSDS